MIDLMPQMIEEAQQFEIWQKDLKSHIVDVNKQSKIASCDENCVSNTICVMSPQMQSEKQVILADLSGIALSSGSACSSGKVKQSHVLRAYGYDDLYSSCNIRISWGFQSKESDIDSFKSFYSSIK